MPEPKRPRGAHAADHAPPTLVASGDDSPAIGPPVVLHGGLGKIANLFEHLMNRKHQRMWCVDIVDGALRSHGFKPEYSGVPTIAQGERWKQKDPGGKFMLALAVTTVHRTKTNFRWFIGELTRGAVGRCFQTRCWNWGEARAELNTNIAMLIEIDCDRKRAIGDYNSKNIKLVDGRFIENLNNPLVKQSELEKLEQEKDQEKERENNGKGEKKKIQRRRRVRKVVELKNDQISEPSSPINETSNSNKRTLSHIRAGDTPTPIRKQINISNTEQNVSQPSSPVVEEAPADTSSIGPSVSVVAKNSARSNSRKQQETKKPDKPDSDISSSNTDDSGKRPRKVLPSRAATPPDCATQPIVPGSQRTQRARELQTQSQQPQSQQTQSQDPKTLWKNTRSRPLQKKNTPNSGNTKTKNPPQSRPLQKENTPNSQNTQKKNRPQSRKTQKKNNKDGPSSNKTTPNNKDPSQNVGKNGDPKKSIENVGLNLRFDGGNLVVYNIVTQAEKTIHPIEDTEHPSLYVKQARPLPPEVETANGQKKIDWKQWVGQTYEMEYYTFYVHLWNNPNHFRWMRLSEAYINRVDNESGATALKNGYRSRPEAIEDTLILFMKNDEKNEWCHSGK